MRSYISHGTVNNLFLERETFSRQQYLGCPAYSRRHLYHGLAYGSSLLRREHGLFPISYQISLAIKLSLSITHDRFGERLCKGITGTLTGCSAPGLFCLSAKVSGPKSPEETPKRQRTYS